MGTERQYIITKIGTGVHPGFRPTPTGRAYRACVFHTHREPHPLLPGGVARPAGTREVVDSSVMVDDEFLSQEEAAAAASLLAEGWPALWTFLARLPASALLGDVKS